MAQTKRQKQERVLKYWEKELQKRLNDGWADLTYPIIYAKSQINILKRKLEKQ